MSVSAVEQWISVGGDVNNLRGVAHLKSIVVIWSMEGEFPSNALWFGCRK